MKRLAAAALLLAAAVPWGQTGASGVRPDIVLNKEVYRDPRLGDHLRMTHTVARGDNLWKSLTKVYGWEKEKIPEALRQVIALNPSIKNPNLIYPNQKLLVPVPVRSIEPPPPPPVVPPAPAEPTPTATPVPEATPTPTPIQRMEIRIGLPSHDFVLPAGHVGIVEGIAALFGALGSSVQTSGDLIVPIASGGSISVDTRTYPVISLHGGRKLLADVIGGIGERDRGLLATHWKEGEVIAFGPGIPPRLIVDRLLEAAAFARFRRREEITCGRQATLTMVPDWQVVVTEEDLLSAENMVLVSWLEAGGEPLPPEWSSFLAGFGFTLVEIGPGATPGKTSESPAPVAFDLKGMEVIDAVESLSRGLGLSTRRGLAMQVSDPTGLPTPAVRIDLTVTRGANLYLMDFGNLRPEEAGLLSSYNNRLIVISPNELANHWIPRVMGTMGYRAGKVNSYFTAGGDGRAILKLPTVQLQDDAGTIVFADGELQRDLLYYLRRQGSRIGIY